MCSCSCFHVVKAVKLFSFCSSKWKPPDCSTKENSAVEHILATWSTSQTVTNVSQLLKTFTSLEISYKLPDIPGIPGQDTYSQRGPLGPWTSAWEPLHWVCILLGPSYHVYFSGHNQQDQNQDTQRPFQRYYYRKPAFYLKYTTEKQQQRRKQNSKWSSYIYHCFKIVPQETV